MLLMSLNVTFLEAQEKLTEAAKKKKNLLWSYWIQVAVIILRPVLRVMIIFVSSSRSDKC